MNEDWAIELLANLSYERIGSAWPSIVQRLKQSKLKEHPLGFLHAVLVETADIALRLHIWKPGMRTTQQPAWLIHTHSFELRSIVLFGSLENTLYRWENDTAAPQFRIYENSYDNGISSITATQTVGKITRESSSRISRGLDYSVPYGSFHQTEVTEDQFTATIAFTKKHSAKPLVVGEVNGESHYSYLRNELRDNQHRNVIDEVDRHFRS